jgi:HNH endonuclease
MRKLTRREVIDEFINRINKGDYVVKDGKIYKKTSKGLKRCGTYDKDGYRQVGLRIGDYVYTVKEHRLLYAYYHGLGKLDDNLTINHINGKKDDNRKENLEQVTQSENNIHSLKMGLRKPPKGEKHVNAKLTEEQARQIKRMLNAGINHIEIAKKLGVSYFCVFNIKRGITWRHLYV